jgi:hypothetical protein
VVRTCRARPRGRTRRWGRDARHCRQSLTVAANAVLVAQHLLKLGAHLTTALARLQVHNLARRSSLEVGSKRGEGRGEWKNVRNSVW